MKGVPGGSERFQIVKRLFSRWPHVREKSYRRWVKRHESRDAASPEAIADRVAALRWRPRFSIVLMAYDAPDLFLLERTLQSVLRQSYADWELCVGGEDADHLQSAVQQYAAADDRIKLVKRQLEGDRAELMNGALALACGDYVCVIDQNDEIAPNAFHEFAEELNHDDELDFIYSDEDSLTDKGQRCRPFFKPDWSPEYLETSCYTGRLACFRLSIVRQLGGFRTEFDGASAYDLVLRFTEERRRIGHIPKILYHRRVAQGLAKSPRHESDPAREASVRALEGRIRRAGKLAWVGSGAAEGCFDVRRAIEGGPKVSIIIPTAGRDGALRGRTIDLLAHCVESIFEASTYENIEVIVVHNGDLRDSTITRLAPYPIVFVVYEETTFNIAKKMNLGAAHATGDYIVTLNDDIEVISPDWIEAMLSIAQKPDVGVVGAKLYFEDGTLQHVGVAFWTGLPDHIRRGFPRSDPGYFFSSIGQRNYLAVTGACALTRRSVFESVGGYDEAFAVNYNDIDYCLKVYRTGLRVVYAAQAELYHFESLSRGKSAVNLEISLFLERWGEFVKNDPYYSSYFDSHPPNFELKDKYY